MLRPVPASLTSGHGSLRRTSRRCPFLFSLLPLMYADIVLPLALPGAYTYLLPPALQARVQMGSRVVVPLGKSKRYTGIVIRLHDTPPQVDVRQLKTVEELVDAEPLLLPRQIDLWRWMAQYYLCHPGEVMKAALPAGLKLESETLLAATEAADTNTADLSTTESDVLRLLAERPLSLADLRKKIGRQGVAAAAKRLLEDGAIEVEEKVSQAFKSKTEMQLRLADGYRDEARLHQLYDALQRSPKQLEALTALLDLSAGDTALALRNFSLLRSVRRADLLQRLGNGGAPALNALIKKKVVEAFPVEVGRLKFHRAVPELERPLSPAQRTAFDDIVRAFSLHDVVLLKGVTSSGKTEVYTQLIRRTLAEGKQVLYLLPEIALTTQITDRLGRYFGEAMGVYHSKFPDNERVELWHRQLSSQAFPLILGVRSALFLPFRSLGLIIVDEEHETSYKQQDPAPRYHARDAAIVMARQHGAKVLLGTATPSLETYTNALSGKYGLVQLTHRFGDVKLPHIVVEDLAELKRKKLMPTPFSPRLKNETEEALRRGEQAIFFLNRRGYSPSLQCNSCGWTPRCTRCDVALTLHLKARQLVCHYCGAHYDIPTHCPQCEQADLRDIGTGTEKLEAAVEACFPEAKVGRMDLDTTRSRTAYERIIRDFQTRHTNLLVGTQMLTKGLDFDGVTVVGILNADQLLNQCDFRAHERAFQMLTQVAGRAGRRGAQGRVVLQTRQPRLPVVQHIVGNDYEAMYAAEMTDRRQFRFPPEVRLIAIYLKHRDERTTAAAARTLSEMLRPHFGDDLLGPDRPPVGFVQMLHIRKLLLKVSPQFSHTSVRTTLLAARQGLLGVEQFKRTVVYFDADPL